MANFFVRYVRREFEKSLPSEETIRRWTTRVDGEPGFNQQSLDYIKGKAENDGPVLVAFYVGQQTKLSKEAMLVCKMTPKWLL